MGDDKPTWEDLPSLEGLEMDWDFEPEKTKGKRAYTRLTLRELDFLFKKKDIPVKLVTERNQCTAYLVDVSQGGVCLRAKVSDVTESQLVKLGFFLGNQKVVSKGRIKHVREDKGWSILGIEFVGLSGDNYEYLAGLYTSIKLNDRDF
jgi:hypothetical protein